MDSAPSYVAQPSPGRLKTSYSTDCTRLSQRIAASACSLTTAAKPGKPLYTNFGEKPYFAASSAVTAVASVPDRYPKM
ncbi:MAG TPA: hypothetical protein VGQ65_03540 [Thermoanaerobaculia bacterium]|nr:hypothetical protein [Thermoanaerobaculia bacterium]